MPNFVSPNSQYEITAILRFEPGMPEILGHPAWIGMDDAGGRRFVPEAMRQFSSATIRTRRVVSLRAALWVDVPKPPRFVSWWMAKQQAWPIE